jgi:hypothetical protein
MRGMGLFFLDLLLKKASAEFRYFEASNNASHTETALNLKAVT